MVLSLLYLAYPWLGKIYKKSGFFAAFLGKNKSYLFKAFCFVNFFGFLIIGQAFSMGKLKLRYIK
ncbi:hypothetical protein HX99_00350 [Peptococcaceae bacterium SCADC1_2_3]|nr:hypothetical protein DK28_0212525 [Peptococcaceae bacterium SCADC1_2_3]KFI37156.1 hypothetical protein HX99_00350 [Peptococcaceae bacterium SCADC1_2_3]